MCVFFHKGVVGASICPAPSPLNSWWYVRFFHKGGVGASICPAPSPLNSWWYVRFFFIKVVLVHLFVQPPSPLNSWWYVRFFDKGGVGASICPAPVSPKLLVVCALFFCIKVVLVHLFFQSRHP